MRFCSVLAPGVGVAVPQGGRPPSPSCDLEAATPSTEDRSRCPSHVVVRGGRGRAGQAPARFL